MPMRCLQKNKVILILSAVRYTQRRLFLGALRMMGNLFKMFGPSPIKPIEQHMYQVYRCAKLLLPFVDAVLAEQWDEAAQRGAELKALAGTIGLLQNSPEVFFKQGGQLCHLDIDAEIAARKQAREQENWAEADRIRQALLAEGIVLEDRMGETTWHAAVSDGDPSAA